MPSTIARHCKLDWLRIGAFFLLILYRAGMVFAPWGWHIDGALVTPDWVTEPMLLLNPVAAGAAVHRIGLCQPGALAKLGGPAAFARRARCG